MFWFPMSYDVLTRVMKNIERHSRVLDLTMTKLLKNIGSEYTTIYTTYTGFVKFINHILHIDVFETLLNTLSYVKA